MLKDPYLEINSLVHRMDARVKLLLVLTFLVSVALTPAGSWPVFILLFALVIGFMVLAELDLRVVFRRSLLALPFILAAVPLLFTAGGQQITVVSNNAFVLNISQPGLVRFVSLAIKSFISVQAAILLAATTSMVDITAALADLGLPRILVAIINLMWRYLFLMVDETLRLLRARTARSSRSGQADLHTGGSISWRARVTGGMAGSLFLRSYERSERVYQAMQSRGYNGTIYSLPRGKPVSFSTRLVFSTGFFCLILLLVFGYYFGI